MQFSWRLVSLAVLLFPASLHAGEVPEKSPPNILVIMADDLGYGDVSCYGATALQTPHIDRLASQGVRFTSGYCSASTCTPTRYSLLTGTYAFRFKGTGIAPRTRPRSSSREPKRSHRSCSVPATRPR